MLTIKTMTLNEQGGNPIRPLGLLILPMDSGIAVLTGGPCNAPGVMGNLVINEHAGFSVMVQVCIPYALHFSDEKWQQFLRGLQTKCVDHGVTQVLYVGKPRDAVGLLDKIELTNIERVNPNILRPFVVIK